MANENTTALVPIPGPTATEMRQGFAALVELKSSVMRRGVDYGTIPGCGDRDTLLKPGAEKVLKRFMVHVVDIQVDDLSTMDCFKYRVRCVGQTPDGIVRGVGIGSCSSDEEKYRWRRARNAAEWKDTPDARRRVKHATGKRGDYTIDQVRTNPADVDNTVLKIGKKRAMVDLALTSTAASDFFTQDLEDMSPEMRDAVDAERRATGSTDPINTTAEVVDTPPPLSPRAMVWQIAQELGLTGDDVKEVLATLGAPEDSKLWTTANAETIAGGLRDRAENPPAPATPEPTWYEKLTQWAQKTAPTDWQNRLGAAIVDAGHGDTPAADFTEATIDQVRDQFEKSLGM